MPEVKEKEFELFFANKANINMNSYKVDAKTQLPVLPRNISVHCLYIHKGCMHKVHNPKPMSCDLSNRVLQ